MYTINICSLRKKTYLNKEYNIKRLQKAKITLTTLRNIIQNQ